MGPSNIRRDPNAPLRTRFLENGTLVVENAYEGTLFIGDVPVAEIKGISARSPWDDGPGAVDRRADGGHPADS